MTIQEQIDAVERDRKTRETGLMVALLALGERARKQVNRAIRVGGQWANALRGTLLGDDNLDQPGGVPVLAGIMADTHHAGVSRVGRILGVPVAPRHRRKSRSQSQNRWTPTIRTRRREPTASP